MGYSALPPNAYIQNGRIFIPGLTGNIPAGNLKIRVRASGKRPTGYSLASNAPFTENISGGSAIRPAAPTFVSYSDSSNTYTFKAPAGYTYLDCDYILNGIGPIACTSNTINVGGGDVAINAIEVFVRQLLPQRYEGEHLYNHIVFKADVAGVTTPEMPVGTADDTNNTLTIYHPLGVGELLLSVNSGAYTQMTESVIQVGNISLPVGYYKVKVKAAAGRTESSVYNSPQFYATATATQAPEVQADDAANTLTFSSPLGNSEIVVSVNNGAFNPYTGTISVGNVDRPAGYYKAKIRAAAGRAESSLTYSPTFTNTSALQPEPPTVSGDDATNQLSFSHTLGTSEIVVSINGSTYLPYAGPYNVGDVNLPAGYYLAKIKSAIGRNESTPTASPKFSQAGVISTPAAPTVTADDTSNTISASHALGTSEIDVSVNNGAFTAYNGLINVGDVDRPAGYYRFKVRAATGRNESVVAASPAFNKTVIAPPVNQLPVVTSISVRKSSYAIGEDAKIDYTTNDPDGTVSEVRFYTNPSGTGSGITTSVANGTLTISNPTAGTFTYYARAVDDNIALGPVSAGVTYTVTEVVAPKVWDNKVTGGNSSKELTLAAQPEDYIEFDNKSLVDMTPVTVDVFKDGEQVASIPTVASYVAGGGTPINYYHAASNTSYLKTLVGSAINL